MSKTRMLKWTFGGVLAIGLIFGLAANAQRFGQIVQIFYNGGPQLEIGDSFGTWAIWAGGNFHIRQGAADRMFINGSSLATNFAGPVAAPGFHTMSSRAGKTAIRPLTEAEARDALQGLQAVSYRRKDDPAGHPELGFIAEDVPSLLATPNRDALSAMEFVAVMATVLRAQEREIAQLRSEIAAAKARPAAE